MRKNVAGSTGIACALLLLLSARGEFPPPPQFIGEGVIGLNKKAPARWPNLMY